MRYRTIERRSILRNVVDIDRLRSNCDATFNYHKLVSDILSKASVSSDTSLEKMASDYQTDLD